jgi:hypothetical protein
MSHASSLIDSFLAQIRTSYPEELGHKYIIEETLKGTAINVQPDIQVLSKTGDVICVVEIGYTRPEKLALYKELKIPDIRWYSKEGEFLNAHEHIHMTDVVITYHEYIPTEEIWREVDLNQTDGLFCQNCFEARYIAEKCEVKKIPIGEDTKIEMDYEQDDPTIFEKAHDEWINDASIFGELWTNGVRWFCIWFCDECGGSGFMTGDELDANIFCQAFYDVETGGFSYDEFLKQHYREMRNKFDDMTAIEKVVRGSLYSDLEKAASFEDLTKYISETYDYPLEYGKIGKVSSKHKESVSFLKPSSPTAGRKRRRTKRTESGD